MIRLLTRAGVVAAALLPAAAHAQIDLYVGVEAGVERRQALADGDAFLFGASDVLEAEGTGPDEGVAYGLVAGAEAPLTSGLFVGVEGAVTKSEAKTAATRFRGVEVVENIFVGVTDRQAVRPRIGYSVTGRLGFDLTRSVAVYALAGAGAERVRIELGGATEPVDGSPVQDSVLIARRSFDAAVFGAGARWFVTERLGARLEYRRSETDDGYDPQQLMAGLLYRF